MHPQVAINLAQWLSPKFAVLVSRWVFEWASSARRPTQAVLPYHLRRYIANMPNLPHGHFSILTEMTIALIAPLEILGYTLPERYWPDISEGRMFCKWLRDEKGIDTDKLAVYAHVFEDRRPAVQAKAYPNHLLADFRRHLVEVWLPLRSHDFFKERDPAALPYLKRLLAGPKGKAA